MLPEESFCQAVEVISENTKGNLEYCAHKSFYLLDLNENFLLFLNLKKKKKTLLVIFRASINLRMKVESVKRIPNICFAPMWKTRFKYCRPDT